MAMLYCEKAFLKILNGMKKIPSDLDTIPVYLFNSSVHSESTSFQGPVYVSVPYGFLSYRSFSYGYPFLVTNFAPMIV